MTDERRKYGDKLWISIMAGVVLSDLDFAVNKVTKEPALRIVRSIPNTPVKVMSLMIMKKKLLKKTRINHMMAFLDLGSTRIKHD